MPRGMHARGRAGVCGRVRVCDLRCERIPSPLTFLFLLHFESVCVCVLAVFVSVPLSNPSLLACLPLFHPCEGEWWLHCRASVPDPPAHFIAGVSNLALRSHEASPQLLRSREEKQKSERYFPCPKCSLLRSGGWGRSCERNARAGSKHVPWQAS